jgi:hypothetical protein
MNYQTGLSMAGLTYFRALSQNMAGDTGENCVVSVKMVVVKESRSEPGCHRPSGVGWGG